MSEPGPAPAVTKAMRIAARLTQEELGQRLGVSRSAIGLWESGRRRPRPPRAAAYQAIVASVARLRGDF